MPDIPEEYAGLIKTGDSLDRSLLSKLTKPFIEILLNGDKAEIVYTQAGENLSTRNKLIVYLLGRKVLNDSSLLDDGEVEGLTPSQLEEHTHIPGGSIRPKLKELLQLRFVYKDQSVYSVPNYSLRKIANELEIEA